MIDSIIRGEKSEYTCPSCGHKQEVNLFPLIDFSKNPEYYALVKDLSIYSVKCDGCGKEQLIKFDSLIVDHEHGYILYMLSNEDDIKRFRHQITYFVETILNKDEKFDIGTIKTRVVTSYNELLEKMAIFEIGLDDEAMEVLKATFEQIDGFDSVKYDEIRFDGIDGTNLLFVLMNSRSNEITPKALKIDIGAYNKIIDDTKAIRSRKREYFEKIDRNWVSTVVKE